MQNADMLPLILSIAFGVFTIVGAMIAMMLWVRAEANSDRRDSNAQIKAIQASVDAIREEMRDFHNRLVAIEKERNKILLG